MSKKKNKVGEKYHRLLVIEELESKREPSGRLVPRVKVKCDCGVEKETNYKLLRAGRIKSCGCYSLEYSDSVRTKIDIGQVFTHWTVLEETKGWFDKNGKKGDRSFLCQCVCGVEKEVNRQTLSNGQSKSCGCHGIPRKEKIEYTRELPQDTEEEEWKECVSFPEYYISTKGRVFSFVSQKYITRRGIGSVEIKGKAKPIISEMYETFIGEYPINSTLYYLNGTEALENIRLREINTERTKRLRGVYAGMRDRCNNPNNKSYPLYGGKGIKVEESFSTADKFIDWAIEQGYQPDAGLEIDRINSTKGYSIENCRWVTKIENGLNVRYINLTLDDLRWIRSDDFTYKEAEQRFISSRATIENIREYRTFIEAPSV